MSPLWPAQRRCWAALARAGQTGSSTQQMGEQLIAKHGVHLLNYAMPWKGPSACGRVLHSEDTWVSTMLLLTPHDTMKASSLLLYRCSLACNMTLSAGTLACKRELKHRQCQISVRAHAGADRQQLR